MGHIKTEELSNGNYSLEITYGGKEAPFGGVDSSAPPAYIDPRCFTQCDGFIVVDNKLVAASINNMPTPVLWGGSHGVMMIGFGTFYNSKYGTLNYALGYKAVAVAGTPTGVDYTFYMTSWSPASIATFWNDTLDVTLFNSVTPSTAASITLQLQTTSSATPGTGATVNITSVASLGTNTTGNFYLPGIVNGISVTGGTGYAVGSTYWVQQGTNVTAQIQVQSVGSGGSITSATLVPNSYSTTHIDNTNTGVAVSTAGWGYSTGAATLSYATLSNVVLEVSGPSGTTTYTVASNGVTGVVPTLPGSGASFAVTEIYYNGLPKNLLTQRPTTAFSNVTISKLELNAGVVSPGGTNYSVGQVYTLASAHTVASGFGFAFDNPNTLDAGVQIEITAVGAGGAITDFRLLGTGLGDSSLNAPVIETFYVVAPVSPVAIPTITSGPAYILNNMAAEINGTASAPYNVSDPNVTAAVNIGSSSLILTAITPGAIGNTIFVQDFSTITGGNLFYYYFPCRTPQYLTGGTDGAGSGTTLSTTLPTQASIAAVGGTLYIGNIGPMIIKYGGPGAFVVSTTYQGVKVLRKYAGCLIGLGLIPATNGTPAGTVTQAADMIFTWTTAGKLDNWNPLDLSGNITGAGFEQLADIADYLTGLIVTNATAFIIRSQGVSYATATGNATLPFSVNHIGLGDEGEGAQIARLVTQYDQTGVYVGNSNIYQLSGSISTIGEKIKMIFFEALNSLPVQLVAANICAVSISGDVLIALGLQVGDVLYLYNVNNQTWTTFTTNEISVVSLLLGVFNNLNTFSGGSSFSQTSMILGAQYNIQVGSHGSLQAPIFYQLSEGVPNVFSISTLCTVTFGIEEIAFGRDVTIDSWYVSLVANVSENVTLNFSFNDVLFASETLTPTQFNSVDVNTDPTELQIFPLSGAFTIHSPHPQIQVVPLSDAGTAQIRFTKIAIFGSFDPSQRPV